ncbi:hypothetical protein OPV22_017372 [Ensete ventricosum]|uniref:Uncharacterized protein n=1 Tax=Ensete ventricosum TaxID=4639 RepID=A0AAV8R0T2_ENSVE|nr:hypothetical protein OPV22_017372 [Ensete ventricosum]
MAMRSVRNGVAAFQVHAIPFHSFLELLLYNPPTQRWEEEEAKKRVKKAIELIDSLSKISASIIFILEMVLQMTKEKRQQHN